MQDTEPVAVVAGASGGIGTACVRDLVRRGLRVVAAGRTAQSLRGLASAIDDPAYVRTIKLDLATTDDGDEMVEFALESFGRLDCFVNTAAVYRPSPAVALTPRAWEEVMGVNLRGALLVTSSISRHLVAQGSGRIVQVSSITAMVSRGGYTLYEASKAGLMAGTRSMAVELAARGVVVNSVAPGWIRTPMSDEFLAGLPPEEVASLIPIGRVGEAEEVAEVVGWLATTSPPYLTGQTLVVDGGQTSFTAHL